MANPQNHTTVSSRGDVPPCAVPLEETINEYSTMFWKMLVAAALEHGDLYKSDIAARTGYSRATVSNWQDGILPAYHRAIVIADLYHLDEDELLLAVLSDQKWRAASKRSVGEKMRKPLRDQI